MIESKKETFGRFKKKNKIEIKQIDKYKCGKADLLVQFCFFLT